MNNKTKITVEAKIDAPIKNVWDCYTNPEHIVKWNFASEDWHCPSAINDLSNGGKLSWRMESKDGKMGFDFEAIYADIIKHKKISYTMLDGRKATVILNNLNDKTEVTVTFDAETKNPIELQRDGWQAILNNFKKYVENN